MCNECWKEFRGWCKSFTRTEVLLALLEVVLLVICVAFIVFLIGHFIVCRSPHLDDLPIVAETTACAVIGPDWPTDTLESTTRSDRTTKDDRQITVLDNDYGETTDENTQTTVQNNESDETTDENTQTTVQNNESDETTDENTQTTVQNNESDETTEETTVTPKLHTTLSPDVECTWTPSYKTIADTRYYVGYRNNTTTKPRHTEPVVKKLNVYVKDKSPDVNKISKSHEVKKRVRGHYPLLNGIDQLAIDDESDGEEAADEYRSLILALVRRRSDGSHVFGCVVTAVSEHWAVTCASCLDAVEETDALDAYMMVERWGESVNGRAHAVSDVSVHPRYGSAPALHDAAALRSADALLRGARPLALPRLTHYMLLTIGERLTILGFGPFRSPGKSGPLREAHVYSLGASQCAGANSDGDGWSSKHLSAGAPQPHAACSHGVICAGVMYARGAPCAYCAGTPLIHRRTLIGVAAAAPCGEACDPAAYVNVAALRDWLDDLMQPD